MRLQHRLIFPTAIQFVARMHDLQDNILRLLGLTTYWQLAMGYNVLF